MNGHLQFGPPIDGVLERLYAQNAAQNDVLVDYFTARAAEGWLDWNQFDDRTNQFLTMTLPIEGGLEFTVRAR